MKNVTLLKFKTISLAGHASLLFFLLFAMDTVALAQTWDRDETTEIVPVEGTGGRVWMDRNLGASRAAESKDDAQSYGSLFQWGRSADGHQNRDSETTVVKSSTPQPSHGDFITGSGDWQNSSNILWEGVNGENNPCPVGYRIPTTQEWQSEIDGGNWSNRDDAFNSPLKLPSAGLRSGGTGGLFQEGNEGRYWSSAFDENVNATEFRFTSGVNDFNTQRIEGYSVRCISTTDSEDRVELGQLLNTVQEGTTSLQTGHGSPFTWVLRVSNEPESGFTIYAPQGFGSLIFRYSAPAAADYSIIVNDDPDFSAATGGISHTFSSTGSLISNWEENEIHVEGNQGDFIHVKYTGSESPGDHVNFDIVTFTPPPPAGDGTEHDPYLISTVDDFKWVRDNTNDGTFDWNAGDIYFEQQNNIDLDGIDWDPIGTSDNAFQGIYDGAGYLIENLTIDRPSESSIGLFGQIDGATIRNLGITNADITASSIAGVLVGRMESGTIEKSFSQGEISADSGPVGGLVGSIGVGEIRNSYARVDVSSGTSVNFATAAGGLFGLADADDVTITNSYAAGEITATNGSSIFGMGADGGGSNTFHNLFYDEDLSNGLSAFSPGTAKSTAEMQQQATFSNWDFQCETTNGTDNIWGIDEGNDYPVLSVFGFEQDCCRNPDNGGEIGSAQTICSGTSPAGLTSTSEASGHDGGDLEYQWQSSITSSSAGFTDIGEATEATYSPGVLTQTTWYRRLARVSCKEDWNDATPSNAINITVDALQQFRSKNGGSWTTAANWEQHDGTDWTDATTYPGGEISNECPDPMVTIQADHAMIIESSDEIDIPNLKIKANGNLTIKSGGKLTILNKLELDEQEGAAIVVE